MLASALTLQLFLLPPAVPPEPTRRRPRVVSLASPRSDPPQTRRNPPRGPSHQSTGDASEAEGEPIGAPLRGLDVLHALHRAVEQKERGRGGGGKSVGRKGKKGRPPRRSEGGGDQLLAAGDQGYGEVRPIEIRSYWEGRIDELERRIQELKARYHY